MASPESTPPGGYVAELVRRLSLDDVVESLPTPGIYKWKPHGHDSAVVIEVNEEDLKERISRLAVEENAAAFEDGISMTEAAWRLLTVHLVEEYEAMDRHAGRIVVDASGVTTR